MTTKTPYEPFENYFYAEMHTHMYKRDANKNMGE